MFDSIVYKNFKNTLPEGWNRKTTSPFNLSIPIDKSFLYSKKKKVLLVVEEVSSGDLRCGKLLGSPEVRACVCNLLHEAQTYAYENAGTEIEDYVLAAINFNYFKTYHLSEKDAGIANKQASARCSSFIAKIKPDLVFVIGDTAAEYLLNDSDARYKRGWVHNYLASKHTCQLVSTQNIEFSYFERSSDADDRLAVDTANLLGYVYRCLANGFAGNLIYDASHVKANYEYVDTIGKFKSLLAKLNAAKVIGCDLETRNLSVHHNSILTFQFAFASDVGYVLPYHHKDTPFTGKELKYIEKKMRRFFGQRIEYEGAKTRQLVGQNFGFDLRILRQELGLPFIYWPVWDTIAGEYLLDENLKTLKKYGTTSWGLLGIFARYGNTAYLEAEVSKDDRATLASMDLNPSVLEYCAMDVQSIMAIRSLQIQRSKCMRLGNKKFYPYYHRMMLALMSCTIHTMSTMEQRGALLDRQQLITLMTSDSEINNVIRELEKKLKKLSSVQEANEILAERNGIPTKGLFGTVVPEVFDIGKPYHKHVLFFEVLELEPVSYSKNETPDGERMGNTGSAFQKTYADVEEVQLLVDIQKAKKIRSSYVKPFYQRISQDDDGKVDGRIRPGYGYQDVVTGRSNSFKPSLQQIPQHSILAKIIKRLFIAPTGKVTIKMDYSAHEVRGWGIISKDRALARAFQIGKNLRIRYRRNPTTELKEQVSLYGDIHKVNYNSFTDVPVPEITKEQRQDSKGITFGSIYGMSLNSLARNIKKSVEETEKIYRRFFKQFSKAASWLEWTTEFSSDNGYTYSPLGRRRNLPGYLSTGSAICAGLERRAKNSPIQGMASDFGFIAARLISRMIYERARQLGRVDIMLNKVPILEADVNIMVHDSIELEAPYDLVPEVLHIMEYCATVGVREYVKKIFNMDFVVGLEVDFELGASGDKTYSWDFTDKSLAEALNKVLTDQQLMGYEVNPPKMVKRIMQIQKQNKADLNRDMPLDFEVIEI